MNVLEEIQRRRVVQTAAVYIAVAWGGTEILTFLTDALWGTEAAGVVSKYLAILFIAGFPVAMYLGWTRDLGNQARRFVSASVIAVLIVATLVWTLPEDLDRRAPIAATAGGEILSLAVLPLDDHSPPPADSYFAPGMTEALIAELSRLDKVRVISRTSVMRYAGTEKPLPEIANELGVDAIVEGSVLRADGRVRVTAQLIEAATDHHLWADTFESDLQDVLALQNEAAISIAKGIGANLGDSPAAPASRGQVNPEAFDAYLRARFLVPAAYGNAEESIAAARRVIEIDPAFGRGHAYLSSLYGYLALTTNVLDGDAYLQARQHARRAIDLEPGLPDARIAMARVRFQFEWDWPAAEQDFLKGLELDANHSEGLIMYGAFRVMIYKDCGLGLELLESARERDPFNYNTHFNLGVYSFHCRQPEKSIRYLEQTLALVPGFVRARMIVPWNHTMQGRHDEAERLCDELVARHDPSFDAMLTSGCAWSYGQAGEIAKSEALIEALQNPAPGINMDPVYVAFGCMGTGDFECALTMLEASVEERSSNMIFLRISPVFDAIRNEPRFERVIAAMNFPPAAAD